MSDQPKPFTDDTIVELTRLEAEATPGPWEPSSTSIIRVTDSSKPVTLPFADTTLCYAARNALPRLLDERAEMVEENKRLQAIVDNELADACVCRDANRGSMELMWKLLRLLLPNRKKGCLCDGCISEEIETREAAEKAARVKEADDASS